MAENARTMIYGAPGECEEAVRELSQIPCFRSGMFRCVHSQEELCDALHTFRPCVFVVLKDGAAGMEGVFAARHRSPELPIFWFSDDHGFGMQSHRLECSYFAVKPLTADKIQKALNRCANLGIQL